MKLSQTIRTAVIVVAFHALLIVGLVILNRSNLVEDVGHLHLRFPTSQPSVREEVAREPEPREEPLEEPELTQVPQPQPRLVTPVKPLAVAPSFLDVSAVAVPQPPAVRAQEGIVRAEDVDRPPQWKAGNKRPAYPLFARRRRWEGVVTVRLLVGERGEVEDVQVVRVEGRDVFREAVLEVARSWTFTPATHEGRARRVWLTQPFRFSMKDP